MKKIKAILCVFLLALLMTSSTKTTTIFVIGDSTAAEKGNYKTSPERGWGMVLQGCFDDRIIVDNHAVNGRSSLSFLNEGRWQKVLDKIKPGDYVFIQFGHNDEKPKPDRHTDPGSTFDANLAKYVNETRAKGGIPVLFNAVVRRCYYSEELKNDDDEKLRNKKYDGKELINSDTLIDTHGAYVVAPRHVAKALNVPFVDATKVTHDIETSMGIEGSRKLHMWFLPGVNPQVPAGKKDNTHYNIYGARIVANALADEIGKQVPALKKHVRHFDQSRTMELTDGIAEALMKTVMKNAVILRDDPKNYDARAEIMWAGSLSHNGLTGCGSEGGDWSTHRLEHELGGLFDVAHGAGLAAVWGSWARYVWKDRPDRFVKFAVNVMGVEPNGTDAEIVEKGICAVEDFYRSIHMPTSIKELGIDVTDEQIAELARKCSIAAKDNLGKVKVLHEADMAAIYTMAR